MKPEVLESAIAPPERSNIGIPALYTQPQKLDPAPRSGKDYSIRYADNWTEISRECKRLNNYKCCYSGCCQKSTQTHHALYFDKLGSIAGREIAGVHIFPLCDQHHDEAHSKSNWVRSHSNPVLNNRNTTRFYLNLRQGWQGR
ncbi:MAG: hypothetical protein HWQ38_09755 [Nostoc sp. NMS7]|uniref:hypothetical protein n=1 Tax=Nostoc sp. NMS7 TaxID=2815391 RepID=UPI0025E85622|nr:hypothetical protein [Nostoc sp. NMS7]MBN3946754.1 hypothetical protein [Nostoc sp. NMS7]